MKTLHTILKLNLVCLTQKHNNNIVFVNDTPSEKHSIINKHIKNCDRILFIDYSIAIDEDSLNSIVSDWNSQCVIYPCVKPGIDWDLFKKKVHEDCDEHVEQYGLSFDTEVGKKCQGDYYWVTKTDSPKVWAAQSKNLLKVYKGSKSIDFDSYMKAGLRVSAYTPARLIVTYPHECIGNILGAAGVKRN